MTRAFHLRDRKEIVDVHVLPRTHLFAVYFTKVQPNRIHTAGRQPQFAPRSRQKRSVPVQRRQRCVQPAGAELGPLHRGCGVIRGQILFFKRIWIVEHLGRQLADAQKTEFPVLPAGMSVLVFRVEDGREIFPTRDTAGAPDTEIPVGRSIVNFATTDSSEMHLNILLRRTARRAQQILGQQILGQDILLRRTAYFRAWLILLFETAIKPVALRLH